MLFATCLLLWLLILERLWFLRLVTAAPCAGLVAQWQARMIAGPGGRKKIREAMVSEVHMQLHLMLPLIKVLVALCPLLGLLGTVVGMIGV